MLDEQKLIEGIGAHLVESNFIPFCILDNRLRFQYVNRPFLDLYEYEEFELLGKSLRKIVGKRLKKSIFRELYRLIRHGSIQSSSWPSYTKNNRLVKVTIEGRRIKIGNKHLNLAVVVDITTQSKLETKLQKSEDLNRLAEKISKRGNFEYNTKTKVLRWTEGMFDLFEIPYSEYAPTWQEQSTYFTKENWDFVLGTLLNAIESGETCTFDTMIRLPNGQIKHLNTIGKIWEKTHVFHGSVRDVTVEKTTEIDARRSEQSFKNLTESLPHIICTTDVHLQPLYMNKVGLAYYGKTEADFKTWTWAEFHPPEDFERLKTVWANIDNLDLPIVSTVLQKKHTGEFRWFQTVLFPNYDVQQNIENWTFIGTDIHEQVTAQSELEKSNTRLRSLIDASPVAIYSVDLDGIVKDFWNPAAERILGWTKEEVLGKFIPHIPESDSPEHHEITLTELQNGQINRILRRTRKTGEEIIVDVTGGSIYSEDGAIEEILVTLMDVTELITQREQLQDSLKEKNTLLQEIHHRVKNNLAIIVSMLQLQVFQSTSEEEKNKLMDAQNRIKSIAMVHELLYSTDEFNKINLHSYYENLLKSITANLSTGQLQQKIHHEISINLESLNINQAIPLGLLINELVTNTFKYAFPHKKDDATIHLSIHRACDTVNVTYIDNGIGFDMNHNTFKSGLGLRIIDSLLSQLDANYNITTEQGFSLIFDFPLSVEKD